MRAREQLLLRGFSMRVAIGNLACSGIEARLDADARRGVVAALICYLDRLSSGSRPLPPPSFSCDPSAAEGSRSFELQVPPRARVALEREARRHGVSLDRISAHAVFLYLADLDADIVRKSTPDRRLSAYGEKMGAFPVRRGMQGRTPNCGSPLDRPALKVMLGAFACLCIESRFGSDVASGVLAALRHYDRRLRSASRPMSIPTFVQATGGKASDAVELRLDLDAGLRRRLEAEAGRQLVDMPRLVGHAVFVYLEDVEFGSWRPERALAPLLGC